MDEKISKYWIPFGDAGTYRTLSVMRDYVHRGDDYRIIKNTAANLIHQMDPRDKAGQFTALGNFVKGNIHYVADLEGIEEIQAPWLHMERIARNGFSYGDCDDHAIALASLLHSVGFDSALDAIATGRRGEEFDHVRALVGYKGQWIPLETTAKARPLGWQPPFVRHMLVKV